MKQIQTNKNKKMKKKILLLSIALMSLTVFSFANATPSSVSKSVVTSFNRQFSNAINVQWESTENYVKAQFSVNDMVLSAYFNSNGELIAITRYISPNQLPLELQSSLKKMVANSWVSDLFEIQTETGTSYYVTTENANQIVILKSEGTNGWQLFQKEKKENNE
jgi:hypothetical protein